ncbi:MAG TPA: glucosyl-3-phosphoglycerate synthase [Verrucomicrobiales bacterium]|nr:glucosyl-3-phosphoglycerate synthase [Verrucomicrobiales bacterium]
MNIDAWLRDHTFYHNEFRDLRALVRAKEKAGLVISVCIPTLDEEKTIGKVILLLKRALQDRYPLVDELAVIDSGSSDRTREIAAESGADVYLSKEILPETGFRRGKGENLWKAVYQLRGDIICYVDADIANIHPRFVYGLAGPLIHRPDIHYVKAFYDRTPGSGGRVTEILVRPLLNLFYPELTALVQPLAGEYAVRREILARLPFPVGYGVETSHLLDVHQLRGLGAFAQTGMSRRVHRNQDTAALGRMSFGILQIFLRRLEAHGRIDRLPAVSDLYRTFTSERGELRQSVDALIEEERPPMNSLPAYRRKFGGHGDD